MQVLNYHSDKHIIIAYCLFYVM